MYIYYSILYQNPCDTRVNRECIPRAINGGEKKETEYCTIYIKCSNCSPQSRNQKCCQIANGKKGWRLAKQGQYPGGGAAEGAVCKPPIDRERETVRGKCFTYIEVARWSSSSSALPRGKCRRRRRCRRPRRSWGCCRCRSRCLWPFYVAHTYTHNRIHTHIEWNIVL